VRNFIFWIFASQIRYHRPELNCLVSRLSLLVSVGLPIWYPSEIHALSVYYKVIYALSVINNAVRAVLYLPVPHSQDSSRALRADRSLLWILVVEMLRFLLCFLLCVVMIRYQPHWLD
jgi:hypothetical protein